MLKPRPFFIIGSPRSGTTLLRYMLQMHPRIAIPRESHFVVGLAPRRILWKRPHRASVDDILDHHWVRTWDFDRDVARRYVEQISPQTYPELVSAVFTAYAAAHDKERWGDKTPGFASHVPLLAGMFGDAQFIHVIRDGRETAASLAERAFGPRTAIAGAFWWRRRVRRARVTGRKLGSDRYYELRLEDLIAAPELSLREVCEFLGEDYTPEMLDYWKRAQQRGLGGDAVMHLTKPPTPGLRDWKRGLTPLEQRGVEAVCYRTLREFGYASGRWTLSGHIYAWIVWLQDLARSGPRALRARLSPTTRNF